MKHSYIAIAIATLLITPGIIAHAETPRVDADINSDIRAEFANDLPKTYDQAITDLRGGANVNVSAKASVNASSTPSTADAEASGDVAFTHTDSTADYVRVVYTGHAKLFGFLPVPVAVEVAAYADGSTRVALPWYQFLLSHDDIATVENSLQAKIQANTSLPSPSGTISAEAQQSVMDVFKSELRAHFTN